MTKKLPYHFESDKCLLATSASGENWPSYIEKALCLMYWATDIQIDSLTSLPYELYHLCGWIPEIIVLKDYSQEKHDLWSKLTKNFENGSIMIGFLASSKLDSEVETAPTKKLQKNQNYVLVSIEKTHKLLTLASPLPLPNIKNHKNLSFDGLHKAESNLSSTNTLIQLSWDEDIFSKFSSLFLSWNPATYSNRKTFHSSWKRGEPDNPLWNEEYSLFTNSQFILKMKPHEDYIDVRVFIDRHVKKFKSSKGKILMGFKVFSYDGSRVIFPHEALKTSMGESKELFSDVLVFEPSTKMEYFVIVLMKCNKEEEEPEEETFFSIGFYSDEPLQVIEMPFQEIAQEEVIHTKIRDHELNVTRSHKDFLFKSYIQLTVKEPVDMQFIVVGINMTCLSIYLLKAYDAPSLVDLGYEHYENALTPGFFYQEFSELTCFLESGRYFLVICGQGNCPTPLVLKLWALSNSYSMNPGSFIQNKNNQVGEPKGKIFEAVEKNFSSFSFLPLKKFEVPPKEEYIPPSQSVFRNNNFVFFLLSFSQPRIKGDPNNLPKGKGEHGQNGKKEMIRFMMSSIYFDEQQKRGNAEEMEMPKLRLFIFDVLEQEKDTQNSQKTEKQIIPMSLLNHRDNSQEAPWGFVSRELAIDLAKGSLLVGCECIFGERESSKEMRQLQLSLFLEEKSKKETQKMSIQPIRKEQICPDFSISSLTDVWSHEVNQPEALGSFPLFPFFEIHLKSEVVFEFFMPSSKCDIFLVSEKPKPLPFQSISSLKSCSHWEKSTDRLVFGYFPTDTKEQTVSLYLKFHSEISVFL